MGSFRSGDVPALLCSLHVVPWRHGTDSLQVSLEHMLCAKRHRKKRARSAWGGGGGQVISIKCLSV